ncbi:DUF87 domain-containing protein [Acidobacteria bacterium AH-259-D05]|nr:DUF87 domain-containing protein [Acidobacteria bacterium AH-259-D05]
MNDRAELEKRLKGLAQGAGYWNEEVKQAIRMAVLYEDQEQIEFLTETFQKIITLDDSKFHPFLPNPEPEEIGKGDIPLGSLTTEGLVKIPAESTSTNILIMAAPGKGKTMLVSHIISRLICSGITVHIFDTQDEYPDLLAGLCPPEQLDIFDARNCKINPFDGPRDLPQKDWVLGAMCNYLRESMYWRDKTIELFRTICMKIYNSGVDRITPALFLRDYFKVPKYVQRLSEFGSLQRFSTMLKTVETFQCNKGESIENLAAKSKVYGLRYLPKDARLFIVSHLVTLHVMSRQYERDRKLDLVLVFDELNQFFTKETLTRYVDIGESFYLELLRTVRKIGVGMILADQTYSLLHDVARSNCQTKIILETRDAPSRRQIARDLELDKEQESFLSEMSHNQEQRRAVAQLDDYPHPFLFNIPQFEKPKSLTPQEMKERKQQAIDSMEWEPVKKEEIKQEAKGQEFLEDKHLRILKIIGCNPMFIQQEYADMTEGMTRPTLSTYCKHLEEAGLLKKGEVNTYGRGKVCNVWLPTKEGYQFLKEARINYSTIQGNGSVAHVFWQYRIWRRFKNKKNCFGGIEYSLKPDGKRVDVGICFPNQKIAYEVVIEDLKKELKNLQKDLAESWDVIVFCVENEEVRKKLDDIFFGVMTPDIENRVEIRLLKEFY